MGSTTLLMTTSCRAQGMRSRGSRARGASAGDGGYPSMAPAAACSGNRPTAASFVGDATATSIGTAIPVAQSSSPAGSLGFFSSATPSTPTVVTDASPAAQSPPSTSAGPKGGAEGKRARRVEAIKLCSRASRQPHQMVGLSRILTTFIFSSSDKRPNPQLRRHELDTTPSESCSERLARGIVFFGGAQRHDPAGMVNGPGPRAVPGGDGSEECILKGLTVACGIDSGLSHGTGAIGSEDPAIGCVALHAVVLPQAPHHR
jgi:hypothetical protein